jgi:hypothetical protein
MTPITVRSGTPSSRRTVAAVWRASCRRRHAGAVQQLLPVLVVGARVDQLPGHGREDVAALAPASAVADTGRIEARVFELAEPVDTDAVPTALLGVDLECLHEIGERGFSVFACSPSNVWGQLFAAASSGGAHNHGSFGAYGRLTAWQSLAALAGAADGASTDEVEVRSRGCSWFDFSADTTWFAHEFWAFGVAAVGPERRRLAVLAATDTD